MRRRPLELQLRKFYAPKIPLDSAGRPARLEFVSNSQTKYIRVAPHCNAMRRNSGPYAWAGFVETREVRLAGKRDWIRDVGTRRLDRVRR
jgi:hypothetical protein